MTQFLNVDIELSAFVYWNVVETVDEQLPFVGEQVTVVAVPNFVLKHNLIVGLLKNGTYSWCIPFLKNVSAVPFKEVKVNLFNVFNNCVCVSRNGPIVSQDFGVRPKIEVRSDGIQKR